MRAIVIEKFGGVDRLAPGVSDGSVRYRGWTPLTALDSKALINTTTSVGNLETHDTKTVPKGWRRIKSEG
jgi:hypothetical protein